VLGSLSGLALQYASTQLQADREVVIMAATQSSDALRYASEALRADREVVFTAMSQSETRVSSQQSAVSEYAFDSSSLWR
jgi:hypothetical protein